MFNEIFQLNLHLHCMAVFNEFKDVYLASILTI